MECSGIGRGVKGREMKKDKEIDGIHAAVVGIQFKEGAQVA